MELEGKTAIVTGASSGIGASTVRKLREAGVRVVGGARRVERIDADVALSARRHRRGELDRLRRSRPPPSSAASTSSTTTPASRSAATRSRSRTPRTRRPSCTRTSTVCCGSRGCAFRTSATAATSSSRARSPAGRRTRTRPSYVAAKFGLRGFVYGLREDLLGRPIRITTVDAGLVARRSSRSSASRGRGDGGCRLRRRRPAISPDEVADCVLFALTRPLHVNVDEIVIKALAAVERRPNRASRGLGVLTILEGSTFCISDDRGDIAADTSGFFAHDTRFLSRFVLRVGGAAPLLLSVRSRRALQGRLLPPERHCNGLPRDSISIARERFVGTGMQERITLRNESPEPLELESRSRPGPTSRTSSR